MNRELWLRPNVREEEVMAATVIEILHKNNGPPGAAGQTGPAAPKGKGGPPGPPTPKPDTPILKSMLGGVHKFVKGQLGLNFTTGALLKQSQIFTSSVGVIFQLLGALVDVMIAPLLPLVIPIIRLLAKSIPWMQAFMNTYIAPIVAATVAWFDKFFGSWTSWGDRIFGGDGLGGLWSNFNSWWSGTATSFIAEQLVALRDYVGEKLKNLWDGFLGMDERQKGWLAQFFITQTGRIPGFLRAVGVVIWEIIKELPRLLGALLRGVGGFVSKWVTFIIRMMVGPLPGMIMTGIRKVISFVIRTILNTAKFLIRGLMGLGKFILQGVMKLPGLIYKGALSLISMIMKGLGGVLGKLPFVGDKLKGMMDGVSKLVDSAKNPKKLVEGLGKKLGGSKLLTVLGGVAKLSKAIPVVGAVATAGFGAYEVGKAVAAGNYAKAGALATKTVAATALTGVGLSGLGLATDIGGTLAANALFKQNGGTTAAGIGATPSQYGMPGGRDQSTNVTVELNMKDEDGRTTSSAIQELTATSGESERFQRQFERG